jgi:rhomboid family GlyGly-CTERM serine protease
LLCAGALLALGADPSRIDWQPSLAWHEPWRALSAAAVHYSTLHLAANLAGALLVGALGAAARVPWHSVAAWAVAWPLTQFGLLVEPALSHFGGLSGVLHAGVAVVSVQLIAADDRYRRRIGIAILVVLVAKVCSETPWGEPLRHPAGWDIAIAPLAHATGLVSGSLCAIVSLALRRRASIANHA